MTSFNSSYMPTTFILLLLLLPLATLAEFSKGECTTCVEQGCTYCKGEEFFSGASVCVCEEFTGFFGDCSDYTFGGDPLTSEFDCTCYPFTSKVNCTFKSQQGEFFVGVIVLLSIPVVIILGCCIYKTLFGTNNPASTTGNSTPAYTIGNDHATHAFPIATGNAIPTSGNVNPVVTIGAYVPSSSPSAPSGKCGDGGGASTFDQLSSGI